ncbi:MAG: hypothetical protein RBU23_01355 [Candidatus Auribacterota bacterium]|jgi:hypothetical protein|nr:hypothetical protein [Candidatus Auribacterota bacterium]
MNSKMAHWSAVVFFLFLIIPVTDIYGEDSADEPVQSAKGLKRAVRFYQDGTIKSVTVTYPDGTTSKKEYNESGLLVKKINADSTIIDYSFRIDDGIKIATERHPDYMVIRQFDQQGYIVMSKYFDHTESYVYEKDNYGDIQSVTIEYDNDSKVTLPTDDKRLSFLWDYDIIGSDDIPLYGNMEDKEYLFNPRRFKERMEMHKQYR